MGHPMTDDEKEFVDDMVVYYRNNKKNFLFDLTHFIMLNILLFYLILLFQNWFFYKLWIYLNFIMGSSITESDLKDLEQSLFKTKLKNPYTFNIILIIIIVVFIYLFYI